MLKMKQSMMISPGFSESLQKKLMQKVKKPSRAVMMKPTKERLKLRSITGYV